MIQKAVMFIMLLGFWLVVGNLLPITQDEAYYALWGKKLYWGYFDHPPLVAFLTRFQHIFPFASLGWSPFFAARFGAFLLAALHFGVALKLYKLWTMHTESRPITGAHAPWGRQDSQKLNILALGLLSTNFFGLVYGVLITPDTGLLFFWTLSLWAASMAFVVNSRYFLLCGVFVGLGLLSKYTMALMGVVLLWPLIYELWIYLKKSHEPQAKKPALLTPWPYLGGLLALMVTLPHLWWNSQNQWITLSFQFRHGFSLERQELYLESMGPVSERLPRAQKPLALDPEFVAAAPFMEERRVAQKKADTWVRRLFKVLNTYAGFFGSQLALWGVWLFLLSKGWSVRGKLWSLFRRQDGPISILVLSSALIPLGFFLLLSPFTKIEANWSAMYVVGAAFILAQVINVLNFKPRVHLCAAATQGLILLLFVWHATRPFLPLKSDRVLVETMGYKELGHKVSEIIGEDLNLLPAGPELLNRWTAFLGQSAPQVPFFVESYQLYGMLQFYNPTWRLRQWPGVTRDSELTRHERFFGWNVTDIAGARGFWLLIQGLPLPKIDSYEVGKVILLRDCKTAELQVIRDPKAFGVSSVIGANLGVDEGAQSKQSHLRLCPDSLRSVYLVRYHT